MQPRDGCHEKHVESGSFGLQFAFRLFFVGANNGGYEEAQRMQGSGLGGLWLFMALSCCLVLLGLTRAAEAKGVVEHRPIREHVIRPVHRVAYRPLRQPLPRHVVRYIRRPRFTGRPLKDAAIRPVRRFYHYVSHSTYLWCVPYAREISHIDLIGDAFLWWAEAAGRYARGSRPEPGAVMAFRSTPQMPLGHVAVVAQVINSREVLVDQANWVHNRITRDVPVIDISPENNWTKVEVQTTAGTMGVPYPTYGFIYDHAPGGLVVASARDGNGGEVAEAPAAPKVMMTAPNRNLQ